MSINHLVNPVQDPKYDIYVRDIEAEELDADTINVVNTINAENVFATNTIATTSPLGTIFGEIVASNKFVNSATEYENETYATNSFVFNSPLYLNGWNSLGDVKTFVDTSNSASTFAPYIETYSITIDGNISTLAPSVFEFRSREGFDELLDIKCQVQNDDGVGDGVFSSVGSLVLPPDDLLNDFQFRVAPVSNFSTPIVPPVASNATLTIEIKVLIDPTPP